MDLSNSFVYDVECFPNAFTLNAEQLNGEASSTWEISQFRDDRQNLFEWFMFLHLNQIPMIGFNTLHYDYKLIHAFFNNPQLNYWDLFQISSNIIHSDDKFGGMIWDRDFFTPQIDLFKIHHFDNRAKSTSLKAVECNMRSRRVVDMPVQVETVLTQDEVNRLLIPYNGHDVKETKQFAKYSMAAIDFRISLIPQLGREVMNYNDSKIGSKILEQRLGDDLCYERSPLDGRRQKRQTPRNQIALNDIIFPFIRFNSPEFNHVLQYLRAQVLKPDEYAVEQGDTKIKTKGVFAGLTANVGGIKYHFGTGGLHGSVSSQRIQSGGGWIIRDIDVASLYPSIAIVNGLYPEHLGSRFTEEYANLPKERKVWQERKGKKCPEANSLKLASNGTYGNSNSEFSVFYDPQFTMTITINGQLMLAMLAEWLSTVPTLQIIQANTDGITYFVHESYEPQAADFCKQWETLTRLTLEDADYSRMFIADVNNYIAESKDGTLKLKGRYWTPDAMNYAQSISEAQPPAWHKDLSNIISTRAAVAAMVHGIDVESYIRLNSDPFNFMLRYKTPRGNVLHLDGREVQKTFRYYVSTNGGKLEKVAPARGPEGQFKRANGVSEYEYNKVMLETGGAWDARVCTKNKSRYEQVITAVQAGYLVSDCCDADWFDWSNVNYNWYVHEARKLII